MGIYKPYIGIGSNASQGGAAFSPLDIAGCLRWHRGDLGVTLNGGDVANWADQSGNGNDFFQPSAGNQPLFLADSGMNGKPGMSFDGVLQYLIAGDMPTVGAKSIVIVYKDVAPPTTIHYMYLDGAVGVSNTVILTIDSPGYTKICYKFNYETPAGSVGVNTDLDSDPHYSIFTFDGIDSSNPADYTQTNNTGVQTVLPSLTFGVSPYPVGSLFGDISGTSLMAGTCCEVIVYDSDISTNPLLSSLKNYLQARYFAGNFLTQEDGGNILTESGDSLLYK